MQRCLGGPGKLFIMELRISGGNRYPMSAQSCAVLLSEMRVEASIMETLNVVADPDWRVEPGLILLLPSCDRRDFVERVWPTLKRTYGLNCGWMDASVKGFRGCTENYCRVTACPSRSTRALEANFETMD